MSDEVRQRIEISIINSGSSRNLFETVLNLAERTAKVLSVFIGSIYVIGYIVTATRLAQYGTPATTLLDAQYFAAGLLPGLLVWLTILVLVSAFLYDSHKLGRGSTPALKWVPFLIVTLFVATLVMELLIIPVSESWTDLGRSAVNILSGLARLVLGELAIWYGIVGWRTGLLSELIKFLKSHGQETGSVYIGIIWLVGFAAIGLSQIVSFGWEAYNGLPQAYGGGKPLQVQLYVDSDKVPDELLVSLPTADQSSSARTVPLSLILQTSTEYIVDPLEDDGQQAWVLKSDAVHAVGTVSP
jgi:hypothetical protein